MQCAFKGGLGEENLQLHDTEGPESCLHLPSDDGSPTQPFLKQMFFSTCYEKQLQTENQDHHPFGISPIAPVFVSL